MKQTGSMRKNDAPGLTKVAWQFLMTAAAFNLWPLLRSKQQQCSLERRKERSFNTGTPAWRPLHTRVQSFQTGNQLPKVTIE